MNNLINYISTNHISFLIDFDKTINIDKSGKAYYFKSVNIDVNNINNFILNLEDEEIFLINPFISMESKIRDPQLNLSRQFLISNKSNPNLITAYLNKQLEIAQNTFGFELEYDNFFLIFKYKKVELK
jgi:hypothetical protein